MRTAIPVVEDDKSEVNLTPMLDVVFIMLVFFVVTATFLNEHGVPVSLPCAGCEAPPADVQSITVVVKPDSTFVVNDRVVSRASLVPYVAAMRSQNPEAAFGLLVARGSRVGDTVAAADAGRAVGYDVIAIDRYD